LGARYIVIHRVQAIVVLSVPDGFRGVFVAAACLQYDRQRGQTTGKNFLIAFLIVEA